MKNKLNRFHRLGVALLALVLTVILAITIPFTSQAQSTLTQTILSIAASNTVNNIYVATGTASSTAFYPGNVVFVDQEAMTIGSSYSSGTTIPVIRGQQGTKAMAHAANAVVFVGPPSWFTRNDPSGSCTASTGSLSTPVISLATGSLWTCSSSLWVATRFVGQNNLMPARSTTLSQTGLITDVFVNYTSLTGPAITYTLPAITGLYGKMVIISGSAFPSASTITVAPAAGASIGNSTSSITLSSSSPVVRLLSIGANWITF